MRRRAEVFVAAWPWLLSVAICAPLLAPGYLLSYDMVWVPDLGVRADTWGLGTALPRAVPSDAVIALADEVLPAPVLQKVILLASLGIGGAGAARACSDRGAVAAVAATSLYVWNPYVAERLALGHWPLLVGYAALPWLVVSGRRLRVGDWSTWPGIVLALAASALSAVGGILGLLVAITTQVGGAAATRWRRLGVLGLAWTAVNGPWLAAGLSYPDGAVSDAAAVERFAVEPEGWLGRLGTLVSLGGIWNGEVVPESRETPLTVVGLVTIGGLVVVGWRHWRATCRAEAGAFAALAAVGLVVSALGWLAPDAVSWLVAHGPGFGLLRDGTRFVALLALGQAISLGWAAEAIRRRVHGRRAVFAVTLVVVWPVAVLPDLAWGQAGRLDPTSYPDAWTAARQTVEADQRIDGDLVVLPFAAYRAPAWNDDQPVLDPAGRFFPRTTVVNDDLVVSGHLIDGEDPRAAAVQAVLAESADDETALARLRALGIGGVVVDRAAGRPGLELGDAEPVFGSDSLDVYRIPGPVAAAPEASIGRRTVVLGGWLVAGGAVAAGAAATGRHRWRRLARRASRSELPGDGPKP